MCIRDSINAEYMGNSKMEKLDAIFWGELNSYFDSKYQGKTVDKIELYRQKNEFEKKVTLVWRLVCVFLSLFFYLYGNALTGKIFSVEQLYYFTSWGGIATCLYFIMATLHQRYPDSEMITKATILFCEIACTLQPVITTVFWVVLWPVANMMYSRFITQEITVAMTMLHGGFISLLLVDFFVFLPNFIFFKSHRGCILGIGLLYTFVNFCVTMMTGTPVYPVVNYKDVLSYVWLLTVSYTHLTLPTIYSV
eukprot:TRINITY_DN12354_c0_g2_i1.p1 TRINITY_DN12354_c0_g2~~TRINITY_DN12354_c0_g2_i1.p1  ORF type:complete len:251 (-),score=37.29 TRINITY_DN12354_c0_g2_i1:35-787(-)